MKNIQKKSISSLAGNVLFWIILASFIALFVASNYFSTNNLKEVPISNVISRANKGEIKSLDIQGNDVKVTLKDKNKPTEKSIKESGTIYEQGLEKGKVEVKVAEPDKSSDIWWNLAVMLVPTIAIISFFIFMMRQAGGQNSQAMSFGNSKAKLYGEDKKKIKFEDIAGNENAKQDLYEIVDFLKDPKKYQKMGAKIPSGVLMVGHPGTGKTMLARAVAGEAKVPFFSISGSEFMEMFVGVGASRVRDLFNKAKKNAPSIIFIDEIDAVGRKRGSGMGGGHDEREQTLNQILVEMDGFEKDTGVIVLAATNRVDVLDPALLRPGRFDRRVEISLPERKDRLAILEVHFKNKPVDSSVDLNALAKKTAGSAGADLANIANEAAILAARNNRKEITNDDLTEAFEKVAIGPERKAKVMSDLDRETTAWHEAGHAVVGHVLPDSDPVHKVTIIPRGQTGGVTWFLPPEDKSYTNIFEYKDILARAMGGRQAEVMIYGESGISTGASSDLRSATNIARNMIVELGMGESLRDQVFHEEEGGMFFDKMTHDRPYSEKTAEKIDEEVAKLIKESVKRAEVILKANKKPLEALTKALLEKETIDEAEVNEILKDAKLPKEAKLH
ncbi:ATP-dependent zinc metalloprotease FtsH [Candidatus Nanogingivalis gingivitcus]|jgi:ATP-dependent zinc metalloprotease ftsH|uniref:ATP-dependent zinc metalloprotease FtsH n=1 Tax=Candidatus Nanogingivalis gingivitcus TaxID=2171992 RepID=A0ABY0FJA9_9BACT|nr:ATP-dependent zinc metalloprotease FtsH [Candidatus Nanogingivalis gingivitcus]RYC73007.1 ATP-dependent zinc metalloprotease FtsH [Candidatus Nanogingivalis gingivitcus]